MRWLLAAVLAVFVSAHALATGHFFPLQQAQDDAESHRSAATTVGVVTVDAIAADAAGRAVDNLKAADFELLEDGTSQSIDDVQFVKIDGAPHGDQLPIRSDSTNDEAAGANSAWSPLSRRLSRRCGATADRVRDALTRFVDQDLGPRDLVTVMKPLDSLLTIGSPGSRSDSPVDRRLRRTRAITLTNRIPSRTTSPARPCESTPLALR